MARHTMSDAFDQRSSARLAEHGIVLQRKRRTAVATPKVRSGSRVPG